VSIEVHTNVDQSGARSVRVMRWLSLAWTDHISTRSQVCARWLSLAWTDHIFPPRTRDGVISLSAVRPRRSLAALTEVLSSHGGYEVQGLNGKLDMVNRYIRCGTVMYARI
jgi:hypothetical protein